MTKDFNNQKDTNHRNSAAQHAAITWDENGQPLSQEFEDVYFSRVSGLDESRHVFIEQNDLPERFQALSDHEVFTIAETGFGSGLNFLCAWECFLAHAPETARLHFVSIEKYPLAPDDLAQALALWPQQQERAQHLIQNYPGNIPGFHRHSFANGRIQFTLIIEDVLQALPLLDNKVNAWFLDGFAPSRNPEMWQPELFRHMVEKSAAGATYSTFTVARMVRHGLADAGIPINRVTGFGKKREMLRGEITPQTSTVDKPWLEPQPSHHARSAVIIGAGLAGASTARALAERGWQITVVDQHNKPAQEASGNPQGMLYARLSPSETPLTQLVVQGYNHSINLLKQAPDDLYQLCGLIQLPDSEKEQLRQQKLLAGQRYNSILSGKTAQELSNIAGTTVTKDGLYFPDGGWINPPAFVNWMLDHNNIQFVASSKVTHLQRAASQWQITVNNEHHLTSPVVVIACGHQAAELAQTQHIPLKAIRGQTTSVPATIRSQKLNAVVCEEGYIAPANKEHHTLGATFHFDDPDRQCRPADHQTNLDTIRSFAPEIAEALAFNALDTTQLTGKVGYRCTTPDYLPVVGPVMDVEQFQKDFAVLRKNARTTVEQPMPWLPGLYINAGHGSRGLITCPLSGEILASQICNEMSPISIQLARQLHPGRFPAKELIRGKKS